jgi:hypothetical protein
VVDRSVASSLRLRPARSPQPRASEATRCRANRQRMLNIGVAKYAVSAVHCYFRLF